MKRSMASNINSIIFNDLIFCFKTAFTLRRSLSDLHPDKFQTVTKGFQMAKFVSISWCSRRVILQKLHNLQNKMLLHKN